MSKKVERRAYPIEVRAEDEGKLVGYAALFDSLSEEMWGFREVIRPGAFSDTLTADVRALWNHNPDYVLGRTKSGTLKLTEDSRGLRIEVDVPDTQWAQDLVKSIKRGDVDQMSFGFRVLDERWGKQDGEALRELLKVELFDVSPVTFPAYTETVVQARSDIRPPVDAQEGAGAGEEPSQAWRRNIRRRRLDLIR